MIAINSDYFTPDFRLANTQSASTCGSLMMALSILLSAKYGGTHTAAERRARWGDAVPEGFVRLSVGIEPAEVLWQAIEAALEA